MQIPEEKIYEIHGRLHIENNILITELIKLQKQLAELKKEAEDKEKKLKTKKAPMV